MLMHVRRNLTVLVAAGTLATGVGSVAAYADATTTTPPIAAAPARTKHCDKATDRVLKLRAELTKLDVRLDKLAQLRVKAVAAHRDELVKKIDGRTDRVHKHHLAIETRIGTFAKACPPK